MGDCGIAQQPGHSGKRLQVIGASAFRRKQEKDEIDRLTVERLEIDRPVKPRKQSEQPCQICHFSVRDGDAVADRRRTEFFPLHQNVKDRALVLAGQNSRTRGKLVQNLLLAVDLERRENRIRRNEIDKRHEKNLT
jgi:hypothetical protein